MSKSIASILVSAVVAGAIAGGSVALYGLTSQSQVSLGLSGSQAGVLATVLGAAAMVFGYWVIRISPDRDTKAISAEQATLVLLAAIATLALSCASFSVMKLALSVPQVWLVPAVATSIVGAFLAVLSFGYGLVCFGERVPDHSTVKNR